MSSTESETVSNAEYDSLSHKIIVEVQKRPALYDTTLRQYSDRNAKNKLWEEVYLHVVNNWMTLSETEKKKKGSIIQKKWKNMRDCFSKELAMQRGKSGQGAIKKKKYVHFDSLLFLVPSLQKRETSSNIQSTSEDNPDIESSGNPKNLSLTNRNRAPSCKKASKSQNNNEDYEQKLLNFLNTKENTCEYDEDINFSQMIVPMLRKLNDDQKHFAKIEIMNVLQKAKSFYPFEPPPIHNQRPRSQLSYTQTPSPQSYYSYSPSTSPAMPIQSPVRQFVSGPAKQTIYLPLNTSVPSTSHAPVHSLQDLEQPEQLLQYVQNQQEEPSAANYVSQFQEQ